MENTRKTRRGFTLMELLFVISIVIVMTGVLFARMGNKSQNDAEIAALQVVAQLRALQSESLNGKVIGTKNACYYNAVFSDSSNKFQILYQDCIGSYIGSPKDVYFDNKQNHVVQSKVNPASTTITFRSPSGTVTSGITIPIVLDANGQQATVCVCGSGNITESKGAPGCSSC